MHRKSYAHRKNSEDLRVMLIANVDAYSHHSAIEGLFKTDPEIGVYCEKIFFDREIKEPIVQSGRTILPYNYRRRGLMNVLHKITDVEKCDAIIVRNLFPALSQFLKAGIHAAIGFWESFPHSYRRLEQAFIEKRALYRKRIEYYFVSRRERRLIEKCHFYLPITETHKHIYHPDLKIPYFPTPMGFDFDRYPIRDRLPQKGPVRFVYIGTIDPLRSNEIVNAAFHAQKEPFLLDYYSASRNETVDKIKRVKDPRIRFHNGIPQPELFREIASADIGICFFPRTKTYITASPTKTLEYGALGLTVLVNPMKEYRDLLDDECAFICEFEEKAIREKIERILHTDRNVLSEMGRRLQKRIYERRHYKHMAKDLFNFVRQQVEIVRGNN